MQSDSIIWNSLNNFFCSYKSKLKTKQVFCTNPYNLTGLCNKQTCPLANSQYATIREEKGLCYLYMKTIERAAFPSKLWEKVQLPPNIDEAAKLIDTNLIYWNEYIKRKCHQRLFKIHDYLARMRTINVKYPTKLEAKATKIEKLEKIRERKALKAAKIENCIKDELITRLKSGTYGQIYNFPVVDIEKLTEPINERKTVEYVEDFEESDISDVEDVAEKYNKEIEYEVDRKREKEDY
ncbi:hypothetical protein A3Q56_02631 [Intoshia linei]|uniref:Protein MAK16 homolog n=1 Tax=Intoshia linei TaxID=1819745 RepID=A0A177B7J6_9BILA|nr:hypothetical protein A3Q56_02631 [Intoshia linei]